MKVLVNGAKINPREDGGQSRTASYQEEVQERCCSQEPDIGLCFLLSSCPIVILLPRMARLLWIRSVDVRSMKR